MNNFNSIVVLGVTASGKTRLACQLAHSLGGEVISMDSRQVYKKLDIGTGKDLDEYVIDGRKINYHLINICEPAHQFYLHDFILALKTSFESIRSKNKIPVLCGGTGLYLDVLRKDFSYTQIKEDENLRKRLSELSQEELQNKLKTFSSEYTGHVDLNSKKRLIRGIEVAQYLSEHKVQKQNPAEIYTPYYIGIQIPIEQRRERIGQRLQQRLKDGLIAEVETLIENGLSHERLQELGLEYKFISLYLQARLTKTEMVKDLETAIVQYTKRQMTWFRKMEKEGVKIHWLKPGYSIPGLISELKPLLGH